MEKYIFIIWNKIWVVTNLILSFYNKIKDNKIKDNKITENNYECGVCCFCGISDEYIKDIIKNYPDFFEYASKILGSSEKCSGLISYGNYKQCPKELLFMCYENLFDVYYFYVRHNTIEYSSYEEITKWLKRSFILYQKNIDIHLQDTYKILINNPLDNENDLLRCNLQLSEDHCQFCGCSEDMIFILAKMHPEYIDHASQQLNQPFIGFDRNAGFAQCPEHLFSFCYYQLWKKKDLTITSQILMDGLNENINYVESVESTEIGNSEDEFLISEDESVESNT